jgi:hypothetical protein
MVNLTKWIILGAGLVFFGLFTREAAATSLTGTLARTGIAGQQIGGALSSAGAGAGDLFRGLMTPLWEVGNFVKSFTGLGSPQQEREELTGQGGGYDDAEQQGGGDTGVNTEPVTPPKSLWDYILPSAYGSQGDIGGFNVGGTDIKTTTLTWEGGTTTDIVLSQEARDYYENIGVATELTYFQDSSNDGGGSNNTTGSGGGGANISSTTGSYGGGSIPASVGQSVSWGG